MVRKRRDKVGLNGSFFVVIFDVSNVKKGVEGVVVRMTAKKKKR